MPLSLWRLVKAVYAATPLDGAGARRYGGRWNERGTPVVYLGGTLSLAALETFVHLTAADSRIVFAAIEIIVPDNVPVIALTGDRLPHNWRVEPPPHETQVIGTDWARRGESLLLQVPSIIVPRESNYLVNPAHSDLHRVTIRPPQRFSFDERMWK